MYTNDLLLKVCHRESVPRPPVWLMRQAGRILPEYRAIRLRMPGFKSMIKNPDIVAEVTIQPIDILETDAAIVFSDILVIPEAMGCNYDLIEKVGPRFPDPVRTNTIDKLIDGEDAAATMQYVYDGVAKTKQELKNRVPLIVFAGAPWTLFAYMIEGGGSKTFSKAKRFLYQHPRESHILLQKITNTIISYLKNKIAHGGDVCQIFDSWAGMLNAQLYRKFCLPYLKQIVEAINHVPLIVFAKGAWFAWEDIVALDVIVGLDWTISADQARQYYGNEVIMQGNFDPCFLYGDEVTIKNRVQQTINSFGKNYISNLGHGVYPDTPIHGVKAFIAAVKEFSYEQ